MQNTKKQIRFPQVNLIPKDPFYDTIIGKFMVWALKVGRYLVVFTEIVVIMSFASRFKLDRDLTDLNTNITQKTSVVRSYADTETTIRLIQKKSEVISKLLQENIPLKQLDVVISLIPNDVKLTRIGYDPDEIQLAGVAKSSTSFAVFLGILQKTPTFKGVTIDQVATGDKKDPGFNFVIRLALTEASPQVSAPKAKEGEPAL
jgi:Tfp pilus assembly protein PilN